MIIQLIKKMEMNSMKKLMGITFLEVEEEAEDVEGEEADLDHMEAIKIVEQMKAMNSHMEDMEKGIITIEVDIINKTLVNIQCLIVEEEEILSM